MMLNRRILRIKVFKTVYAYAENRDMTLKEASSYFNRSCEAVGDLYLFMLELIPALTAEARSRMEAARSKFRPSEEELHPNMKFIENALSPRLSEDPDFTKIISRKKFSWDQYDVFLRRLFDTVRSRQYYLDYMADAERSVAADAALFARIFSEELEDDADLAAIVEDMSILWADDISYALIQCCKTIESLGRGSAWNMPELISDENAAYARNHLTKAYNNFAEYRERISRGSANWDDDRLFNVDVALIVCGLAEYMAFPDTPKGVIINEYVEISKFYSTPRSHAFVNGVLDELMKTESV